MSVAIKNLCVYANSILFYCLDLLLRFSGCSYCLLFIVARRGPALAAPIVGRTSYFGHSSHYR
jgi:hypothetical protein